MKRFLPHIGIAAIVLAAAIWTWRGVGASSRESSDVDDALLACRNPDCGAQFHVSRSELSEGYPRQAEGFKCTQCNQFSAMLGKLCPKCKSWYAPEPTTSRAVV